MFKLPELTTKITKSDIKTISNNMVADILNNGHIIESADALNKMETLIKEIKSNPDWIDYLREQVAMNGASVITSSGTKLELAEVGIKYDFSKCGDEMLNDLLAEQERIDELVKERQTFLKTIPVSGIDVVTISGELVRLYPPSRSSTSSIKTTIAK
jgi:hypothetical protein